MLIYIDFSEARGVLMSSTPSRSDDGTQSGLFVALHKLEARLLDLIETTRGGQDEEPAADPFRGLYISQADVFRDFAEPADCRRLTAAAEPLAASALFARLQALYGLSGVELDVLLIALAPEVDPRYGRIFAYLQDDVRRRLPGIDLILDLLCGSASDKLDKRALFNPSSRLMADRLIRLSGEANAPAAQREVSLDPRIANFLLGEDGLDPRLARSVRVFEPRTRPPAGPGLVRLAERGHRMAGPLPVVFEGADEEEKQEAAGALAGHCGFRLLIGRVDIARRLGADLSEWIGDLAREARLRPSTVYLEGLEAPDDSAGSDAVFGALGAFQGLVILSSAKPLRVEQIPVKGLITVAFDVPPWRARRRAWSSALREQGLKPSGAALDLLAETFRFGCGQIRDAAQAAANLTAYAGGNGGAEPIFEAARSRSGQTLARLTVKIVPRHGWNDIVLPPETLEELRELCRRVSLRRRVMGEWGFARKMSGGKGVTALFHGHSGAGKTMAAEVIARELRLDLYKIDLAGVVSKYIGETERNLDRIFDAAAGASAILLFDEADALFGKRSEVRDAHDRYANLEVSYLLQKMEQHEGVSILATNLRQNLDEAFLRRLAFTVAFPFPDETGRRRIWETIWPPETPLAADVDAGWLAARYMLSGGNIRNVALAAAYLAAKDADLVRMSHVLHAVRREFQKMGKTLNASELASPLAAASRAVA
jgi:hypothetical protein